MRCQWCNALQVDGCINHLSECPLARSIVGDSNRTINPATGIIRAILEALPKLQKAMEDKAQEMLLKALRVPRGVLGITGPSHDLLEKAKQDPTYAPYCLRCNTIFRMIILSPLRWRCNHCGIICDLSQYK